MGSENGVLVSCLLSCVCLVRTAGCCLLLRLLRGSLPPQAPASTASSAQGQAAGHHLKPRLLCPLTARLNGTVILLRTGTAVLHGHPALPTKVCKDGTTAP